MDIEEAMNEAAAEAAKGEYALAYDILARVIDGYIAESEGEIARLEALRVAHHATNVRRVAGELCAICHPVGGRCDG